jgi:hypothetical protein
VAGDDGFHVAEGGGKALHAGKRHIPLHLVDQSLAVEQGALDVGEGVLGMGEMPRFAVPGGNRCLGLELAASAASR